MALELDLFARAVQDLVKRVVPHVVDRFDLLPLRVTQLPPSSPQS
jgi:hypothetical protein